MSPKETKGTTEDVSEIPSREDAAPDVQANAGENQFQWSLENFINFHRNQLESSVVPETFWPALHQKLLQNVSKTLVQKFQVAVMNCTSWHCTE